MSGLSPNDAVSANTSTRRRGNSLPDINPNAVEDDDSDWELLMRHSSPLVPRGSGMASPVTERNSSPSPLRLTRPRSNPRNRTPMRYQSPLGMEGGFDNIPEEASDVHEARRISIRPMAGRAVGVTASQHRNGIARPEPVVIKSRKQGPSHRKVRRWNNDNFVNLAAEINSGNKGGKAAQALLMGQANASQYQTILSDPDEHTSKAMDRLRDEEGLRGLRNKFFEGEINARPAEAPPSGRAVPLHWTPEQMLHRIDARLRKIVVKACENSFPASQVVEGLEAFVKRAHRGKSTASCGLTEDWWKDILLEPPSVTHRKRDNTFITRFLFDGTSANGGFHRLLLHGLCQFHGLQATSNSMELTPANGESVQCRLLTATGRLEEAYKKVQLVEYITSRQNPEMNAITPTITEEKLNEVTSRMKEVKV